MNWFLNTLVSVMKNPQPFFHFLFPHSLNILTTAQQFLVFPPTNTVKKECQLSAVSKQPNIIVTSITWQPLCSSFNNLELITRSGCLTPFHSEGYISSSYLLQATWTQWSSFSVQDQQVGSYMHGTHKPRPDLSVVFGSFVS